MLRIFFMAALVHIVDIPSWNVSMYPPQLRRKARIVYLKVNNNMVIDFDGIVNFSFVECVNSDEVPYFRAIFAAIRRERSSYVWRDGVESHQARGVMVL